MKLSGKVKLPILFSEGSKLGKSAKFYRYPLDINGHCRHNSISLEDSSTILENKTSQPLPPVTELGALCRNLTL